MTEKAVGHGKVYLFCALLLVVLLLVVVVAVLATYRRISGILSVADMRKASADATALGIENYLHEESDGTMTVNYIDNWHVWKWEAQTNSSDVLGDGLIDPTETSVDLVVLWKWRWVVKSGPR